MVNMFKGIWSDLVYAARSLAKAPAFTFVCIVSLGIGMVPVIAVPYLARIPRTPPPGVNTDGLVEIITTANGSRPATNSWSYPDFMDLRNSDTGIAIFAWATAPSEIKLPGGLKFPMWPMYVSADYFKTIGVALARGPGFEGQRDAVVILGHRFWQNHLSSDPEIIGKTLKLDNVPYVIAGIAPDQFQGHLGLQGRELFVPLERYPMLATDPNARFDRGKEWLHIHGRLSQGVSVAQASAAVAGITSQLAKAYPATNKLKAGSVVAYDPLGVLDRSQFLRIQAVALTLTGAVLLVVCLNISGMMQVRSAMRERELSIRQAIGASRLRLARHLLAEAVLLAAVGGTLASSALFNAPRVISRLLTDAPNFAFAVDGGDLYCIKRANTGTGALEVHILMGGDDFHSYSLHTGTPIPLSRRRELCIRRRQGKPLLPEAGQYGHRNDDGGAYPEGERRFPFVLSPHRDSTVFVRRGKFRFRRGQ